MFKCKTLGSLGFSIASTKDNFYVHKWYIVPQLGLTCTNIKPVNEADGIKRILTLSFDWILFEFRVSYYAKTAKKG